MDLYLITSSNGVEALVSKGSGNFYRQSDIHADFDEVKNDPANTVEPYPEVVTDMFE